MSQLKDERLKYHAYIENEVQKAQFGTITFNVVLMGGKPILKTLNSVINKRKKYAKQAQPGRVRPNQDNSGVPGNLHPFLFRSEEWSVTTTRQPRPKADRKTPPQDGVQDDKGPGKNKDKGK